METLDDVFIIGTPKPIDATPIDAFAELFGAPAPPGYGDALVRFGKSEREIGRGFCGLLAIYTPDECRQNQSLGYFTNESAPNFGEHFKEGDGDKLVSIANSVDAEDLVVMPGRAPIYYFPNPRSGYDVEVAGESLIEALELYRARRGRSVAYFVAESAVMTRHDVGDVDSMTLLYTQLKHDLYDEESSSFFYRHANACVSVFNEGRVLKVYTGTNHDAFRAELMPIFGKL